MDTKKSSRQTIKKSSRKQTTVDIDESLGQCSSITTTPIEQKPYKENTMSEQMTSILTLDNKLSDALPPPLLPAGDYPATIIKTEVKPTKNDPNKRYVAVTYRVERDNYPADVEHEEFDDFVDFTTYNVPFNADRKSTYRLRKFVELIGCATNTNTVDPSEWVEKTVMLRIKHSEFEGEMRAEVEKVLDV